MSAPAAGKRRSDSDVLKLIEANYDVTVKNGLNKLVVKFNGPPNTLYEHGVWNVRVELSERYPFEPPLICFLNKIYHPNIDEVSGNVCLDVLNQKWSAMFDLTNIFETFLPQLLTYPNSKDPLNSEAGIMYEENKHAYKTRVREYINRYATESALVTIAEDHKRFRGNPQESPASPRRPPRTPPETEEDHYSSESSMSGDDAKSDHEDDDEEIVGKVAAAAAVAAAVVASASTSGAKPGNSSHTASSGGTKPPITSTITSVVDDDESTIEDDEYLQHVKEMEDNEAKD